MKAANRYAHWQNSKNYDWQAAQWQMSPFQPLITFLNWLKEAMERNSFGKLFQSLAALNLKDFKP